MYHKHVTLSPQEHTYHYVYHDPYIATTTSIYVIVCSDAYSRVCNDVYIVMCALYLLGSGCKNCATAPLCGQLSTAAAAIRVKLV